MRDDIKKLNMYAANVFSTILAQNPNAIASPNRERFITKSFEIARGMIRMEDRKTTITLEIPDEKEDDAARKVQEKLVRDIERSLGLKADAADPLTLAGRLDAIKRAMADGGKPPRVWKVDAEGRVIDKITGWVNEGFKSCTTHNVNETGHRIAFARWSRLDEAAKKMARVIRDMGREAWKDEENFPQPVSFTSEVAKLVGKNMARAVSESYCEPPVNMSQFARTALLNAAACSCPAGGAIRRMQNIVDTAYPVCSNDED